MFWLNLHLASGCTDGEDCTKSYAPAENVVVKIGRRVKGTCDWEFIEQGMPFRSCVCID